MNYWAKVERINSVNSILQKHDFWKKKNDWHKNDGDDVSYGWVSDFADCMICRDILYSYEFYF